MPRRSDSTGSRADAFRILPAALLTVMLGIAVILELTVLDPAVPLWQLWLPRAPLVAFLALPWLRHRNKAG